MILARTWALGPVRSSRTQSGVNEQSFSESLSMYNVCTCVCNPLAACVAVAGLLHGSGKEHGKDYWKNLEGLLLNQGFLEYTTHAGGGVSVSGAPRCHSALSITAAGTQPGLAPRGCHGWFARLAACMSLAALNEIPFSACGCHVMHVTHLVLK